MEGYVMRIAFASVAVVALLATSGAALAQDNSCTTIVLHAVSGTLPVCTTTVDCSAVPPTVDVTAPSGPYTVMMFIKNYGEVAGVQVAFDWPVTWTFGFGLWNCQTGQLTATQPTAPGETTGSITTAFTTITGGALAPIGVMVFNTIGTGCLSIIESFYPFGNHVVDAAAVPTSISDTNEGKICVDSSGFNACTCVPNAVEGATWG
jgi:hypothetical protein